MIGMAVVYGLVEVEALLHGCSHEPLLENLLVGVVRQLTKKKRFSVHMENKLRKIYRSADFATDVTDQKRLENEE